jgi:hypothetical protein
MELTRNFFEKIWIEVEQPFPSLYSGKSIYEESLEKTTALFLILFQTLGIRLCDIDGRLAVFL